MSKIIRSHHRFALVLATLLAACTGTEPTAAPTRSFSPVASVSREATPISGRHIVVLNSGVPSDFADREKAKGGTIDTEQDAVRVFIASGRADSDAGAPGAGGRGATVVVARW